MSLNHVLTGSIVTIAAVFGVTQAIAMPADEFEQHPQRIAQDIDMTEEQIQMPATVRSIQPDQGFIQVEFEDGTDDILFLGTSELTRLGLDTNEEVTVVYEGDEAIALIRDEEVVTLNASEPEVEPSTPMADEPADSETTITQDSQDPESDSDMMTQDDEMEEPMTTTPADEPIPALW
ncbi:MAG: hypothetical protein ACFE0J_14450 [Elainellaceae cyanobacterium]